MVKYVSNCSEIIDWNYIITNIDNMNFKLSSLPKNLDEWKNKSKNEYSGYYQQEVDKYVSRMETSNVNFNFIEIKDYWLKETDPLAISFGNILGVTPILAHITVIRPGHGIFSHWDIDPSEQEQLALGHLKRYNCFISPPNMGQFFIVEDTHIHNQTQGSIWEWDNYKSEHIGVNFGLKTKYLFNFMGYS